MAHLDQKKMVSTQGEHFRIQGAVRSNRCSGSLFAEPYIDGTFVK